MSICCVFYVIRAVIALAIATDASSGTPETCTVHTPSTKAREQTIVAQRRQLLASGSEPSLLQVSGQVSRFVQPDPWEDRVLAAHFQNGIGIRELLEPSLEDSIRLGRETSYDIASSLGEVHDDRLFVSDSFLPVQGELDKMRPENLVLEEERKIINAATSSSILDNGFYDQGLRNKSCSFTDIKDPTCGILMHHNCEHTGTLVRTCPKSCPFLIVDPFFSCSAACVAKGDCDLGGRTMGFEDRKTHLCGSGPIEGCTKYDGKEHCAKCGRLSQMSKDGDLCVFLPGYQQVALLLVVIVVGLLLILVPLNFHRWFCKPVGNESILSYGWRHRLRTQASRTTYNYSARREASTPYPLSTNMHTELVGGTGLCLFYNTLIFLTIVSLTVAGVVTLIWALTSFPVVGENGTCGLRETEDVIEAVGELVYYRKVCAWSFGALWLFLFAVSLYWARFQHLQSRILDRRTSLMSDFGLRVVGLPPDADESAVARFFNGFMPGGIVGVSIAYDYTEHKELVSRCIDLHLRSEEQKSGQLEKEYLESKVDAKKDQDEVVVVLRRLQGSGTAFVVCVSEAYRERLLQKIDEQKPQFRGRHQIRAHEVSNEPDCFFWENFGYSKWSQLHQGGIEVVVLLIELAMLGGFVYWPAAYYIFYRLMATGSDSFDPIVMLLGYGIAIMNCIMYVLVDISSRRIGFHYKVDVDICNLVGCTVIVGAQTFFNLAVAYFAVKTVDVSMSPSLFSSQTRREKIIHEETEHAMIAEKLWYLLVPGILVVPDLFGRLFKYILSAKMMFNYYLYIPFLKRDLRTDRDITPRRSEDQLLPAPFQTEFDYSNNICIASTAFLILFFNTPYASWTCWVFVSWVVLSYLTLKYCHLRFNMVVEYTSHRLDDCFILLWGIPLSIIAAASAYWAAEWKGLPWWTTVLAFGASLSLYLLATMLVLRSVSPYDSTGTGEYAEARAQLGYDYFNTNPIQVLKYRYFREGPPLIYFVRGKEYLQRSLNESGIYSTSYLDSTLLSKGCFPSCFQDENWNGSQVAGF